MKDTVCCGARVWFLAHRVDLVIDREGRYRGVTGPPCEIGRTAAHEV
jgi:hypothetical protein